MLYVTGDVHGQFVSKFSFKHNPSMRELDENDILIVLGDCGVPWSNPDLHFYDAFTTPNSFEQDRYVLNWMEQQKYTWLLIAGNHENYDLIKQMPVIEKYNGRVRQMSYLGKVYDNIFIVDTPQILTLQKEKCLIIPGAESHDYDRILDIDKYTKRIIRSNKDKLYRVNHFTWWEDEKVDQGAVLDLISNGLKVDFILSHDAPAAVLTSWKPSGAPARINPTDSELFLEEVRQTVEYDVWLHGHLHDYIELPHYKTLGLYNDVFRVEKQEVIQMAKIIMLMSSAGGAKSVISQYILTHYTNSIEVNFKAFNKVDKCFNDSYKYKHLYTMINYYLKTYDYVIINDYNVTKEQRRRFYKNVNLQGHELIGIWIEIPQHLAEKNNSHKHWQYRVSDKYLDNTFKQAVSPTKDEPFDDIIYISKSDIKNGIGIQKSNPTIQDIYDILDQL